MENIAEKEYLRGLARQVRAIADEPIMVERQRLWREHNALRGRRPLVLCFPEGAWSEILPPTALRCQDEFHRELESQFRMHIWWWEHINDDNYVLPFCNLGWKINVGDFGFNVPMTHGDNRGSYGCCEGLELRIGGVLKRIPRLRRVSVAPNANQEALAEKLAGKYVYSRKPYPAHVCVGFNEPAVRDDLRRTLRLTGGRNLELILKDTHTVENEPERLTRWVRIAREEIESANR